MPVSETRLAIRLDDRATAGLQNLTGVYSRFSNTVQNSGRQMSGFASNANKAASSLSNMNQMMERLVYSASRYFVIYKALGAVGNVWDTLVGGSYEYAKSLETNQIGIAGILKSMVTLNGEQIKWNDAMALSGKAMKGLQSEALRTAATSKELIETFRALLGPGLSSGMSIDQIVQLSTVGTNAVRSLGLPTNQYVQELRSIITEGIRPASSTLATSLGITNKDIKEAKASAEGLFNFLMKRMQGFSDAVKYTSGTVEGRIARIQEGLQVAGAKGADSLYKAWSNTLERIANYLIPIPKKLGDEWKINPEFIKSIERIAQTTGKIAESLANVGEKIGPALGGLGGGALTAVGQFADKLGYVLTLAAGRKLAPFVADIANIATNSREAYEAQTGLGRAIQAVSDKISGRIVDLQRVTEQQNVYNASIDMFVSELGRMNSLNGMINSNANSITNLAAKWQKMGMDAEKAGEIQKTVLGLTISAHNEAAQAWIKHGDAVAADIEKTKQYENAVKNAFNTELVSLSKVIAERRKKTELDKINSFVSKKGTTEEQFESTQLLISRLQQLELEENQVYKLALQYTKEIERGGLAAAKSIEQQIFASAQNFIKSKENLAVKKEEITLNNRLALEQSALANAYRQGGEGAYQALTKIIKREQNLLTEMQKRGIATDEVEKRHIELLNAVMSATNEETTAILKNTDATLANEEAQVGLNAAKKKTIERANAMISTFGNLSMGFGILCDVIGQADEKNKEWWESAGNAAMQASMFAMAIGSISSAISGMIPALAHGIEWLNKFAMAKVGAGLGSIAVAGGVAAAVGGLIYSKYQDYQKNGRASAIDPWTGEEVSYTNKIVANSQNHELDPEERVKDAHAWIDSPATGNIGLINPPSVGGSSGGGKGGGSAKANKAEEYAAKMQKIYADLNKEIANMSDRTTAYDKVMAQAKDKLAGYEKDIVKAQQLGVDVGEVRNKQIEYQLAMEKKATEAQQDEYLKYMKQDEEAANRINIMGGTMEQQRAVLAERLENHKAYLEELLAANIENRDRRMQLEQELANVQKQINDNSVYEFKSGWTQALDEIANRQVNFKDQVVSAFDSIEGSLVTFISSTGSAKDKFKQFCQDVTNTILKSMTQIIVKGLITKAIMAAIGLGGGTVSVGSYAGGGGGTPGWLSGFSGGSIAGVDMYANGGSFKAGQTAIVGEQGPELVRFGSAGRVYNNNETKSMLGGGLENVKVEVINQSGQDVKADNASVQFDGKTLIISTVLEAVSNNTMGMRTMLKGVATT